MKKFSLLLLCLNLIFLNIYPSLKNVLFPVGLSGFHDNDSSVTVNLTGTGALGLTGTHIIFVNKRDVDIDPTTETWITNETLPAASGSTDLFSIDIGKADLGNELGFGVNVTKVAHSSRIIFKDMIVNGDLNVPFGGLDFIFSGVGVNVRIDLTKDVDDESIKVQGPKITTIESNVWFTNPQGFHISQGSYNLQIHFDSIFEDNTNELFNINISAKECVMTGKDAPFDILTAALIKKYINAPQPINPSLGCCN